jgi:hypothetical protein
LKKANLWVWTGIKIRLKKYEFVSGWKLLNFLTICTNIQSQFIPTFPNSNYCFVINLLKFRSEHKISKCIKWATKRSVEIHSLIRIRNNKYKQKIEFSSLKNARQNTPLFFDPPPVVTFWTKYGKESNTVNNLERIFQFPIKTGQCQNQDVMASLSNNGLQNLHI